MVPGTAPLEETQEVYIPWKRVWEFVRGECERTYALTHFVAQKTLKVAVGELSVRTSRSSLPRSGSAMPVSRKTSADDSYYQCRQKNLQKRQRERSSREHGQQSQQQGKTLGLPQEDPKSWRPRCQRFPTTMLNGR